MTDRIVTTTRRGLLELLAGGAGLSALGLPASAVAESRKDVLVIGLDISDSINYDPAVGTAYTPPAVVKAAYDTLVTMDSGDYVTLKPELATAWARTPDGKGWRFTLRDGVKFNSGNLMTADDVKWSFDRVINIKGQPSQFLPNIAAVNVVDPQHIDIVLKDPARSILEILTASSFVVYERKVLEAQGGVATVDAKTADKALNWLNQHSCGTGAYTLTSWQRNTAVMMERNPHSWRGMPPFARIIIRHMPEPATQLLAIQRGDIDVAFNLIPEQIATVKASKTVRVEEANTLDLVYMTVTANADFNKVLAIREAREAISWAIDYEGIRDNLLGGSALIPASIIPIGVLGSTPEGAKAFGIHEDLAKSKALLTQAGYPDGFSFKLTYGTSLINGVPYATLAQKIQSDLARVGIKAELDPEDLLTTRTQLVSGHSTAMLAFWGISGVDTWIWADSSIERLADREHYKVPPDLRALVDQAADEPDMQKRAALWVAFQKRMIEEAYLQVLFQPIYQIAVSDRIKSFPLNAAGWHVDFYAVS